MLADRAGRAARTALAPRAQSGAAPPGAAPGRRRCASARRGSRAHSRGRRQRSRCPHPAACAHARAPQDCPNTVRLLGCFESEEEVQLVTELCTGGDLQKLSDVSGCLEGGWSSHGADGC
jgi:hypothetical protein